MPRFLVQIKTKYMKKAYLFGFSILFTACILSGCKEDINLQEIDTRAEVEMGFAIPMGSMSATLGDFLGDGQVEGIYVGDDKLLYFRDTFDISRRFHDVDLASKVTDFGPKHFNVYDKLNEMGYLDTDGKVKSDKKGIPITLEFPFSLKLTGINNDIDDERLDSASIINAQFTSTVGRTNLPLPQEWVSAVTIQLGNKEFHRPTGDNIQVCGAGEFRYDQKVPITVDRFILDLMINPSPANPIAYKTPKNVKDTCHLSINFTFTIPTSADVTIPTNATYDYSLNVKFIDYEAIWGNFRPSSDMRDENTIIIEEEWSKWRAFKKATLPFHDPKITMMIGHTIAGVMNMHGEYLYAKNVETNDSIFAYFAPERTAENVKRFESFWRPGEYLPLTSRIGDSIHNKVLFDKDTYRGQIDKMFTIKPDILGYKFYIDFDSMATPQLRVLPDTRIKVEADILAPFAFNEGVEACYEDTAKDVDISKYSLDSLIANVEFIDTIKASDVKVVLAIENRIPLTMRGVVRFYDENMKVIMDPKDSSKPLRLSEIDTLLINAPQYKYSAGISSISEPGKTIYTLDVGKKHFDTLTRIKNIRFFVELDGEDLHDEYKADPNFLIKLNAEDQLKMKIGICTNVDAVFNFNGKDEK